MGTAGALAVQSASRSPDDGLVLFLFQSRLSPEIREVFSSTHRRSVARLHQPHVRNMCLHTHKRTWLLSSGEFSMHFFFFNVVISCQYHTFPPTSNTR